MSTDIYATVRQSDGNTGERRGSEDSGQLEGDREEMVVDIYESIDHYRSSDVDAGPQEDMTDNAGCHTREQCSKTARRPFRAVAVCLWMLCVFLMGGIIVLAVYSNNQLKNYNYKNKTLTMERDQLETRYKNMTMEREQLEARYKNMTMEREQLEARYKNMTLERDQLKETTVMPCSSGSWKKFGCSFYCRTTGRTTWQESRDQCLKIGADLVVIDNTEEQEFIGGLTPRYTRSWIGLKMTGGIWTWVDGTPLTTQYWASGQPDNYLNWDCAYYHKDGGWHNILCVEYIETTSNTICEK